MGKELGIRQYIKELEAQGNTLGSSLFSEIYLGDNFRVAFFGGATDTPRVQKAVRVFYFDKPNEFKVVTIHLTERDKFDANRESMRVNLLRLPGDPEFMSDTKKYFGENPAKIIHAENLRVLAALEISNAVDSTKEVVSLLYPKILTRRFGDEIATIMALSALKLIPIPTNTQRSSNAPIN